MYIEAVPNRSSPPAILLRETYRDGGKIRKRTIANLSDWPSELVEGLRTLLKGGKVTPANQETIIVRRSLPHGHVAAVLGTVRDSQGQPVFEVHTWEGLSPFANIARMIDLLDLSIKVMLVAIVLISVMNVMVMAVYERVREIGTVSAIGTRPGRILALFVSEGLLLGVLGTAIGTLLSLGIVYGLNVARITFAFGREEGLVLAPTLGGADVGVVCATVIAVAVLASLQPAWKAARMDPIQALRHI